MMRSAWPPIRRPYLRKPAANLCLPGVGSNPRLSAFRSEADSRNSSVRMSRAFGSPKGRCQFVPQPAPGGSGAHRLPKSSPLAHDGSEPPHRARTMIGLRKCVAPAVGSATRGYGFRKGQLWLPSPRQIWLPRSRPGMAGLSGAFWHPNWHRTARDQAERAGIGLRRQQYHSLRINLLLGVGP